MKGGEIFMASEDFAPKTLVPDGVYRLKVLERSKTEQFGPQERIKFMVVGGEHDGVPFPDYCSRDENTGKIAQGTKAWEIYQAVLGQDFHKRYKDPCAAIVGGELIATVTKTKTGSRNRLEFGMAGPVPKDEPVKETVPPDTDSEEDFNDIPFD